MERRRRPTAHHMSEIDWNTELYETRFANEAKYAYSEIAVFFKPRVQESSLRVECCKVGPSEEITIELNDVDLRSRVEGSAQLRVFLAWLKKTETFSI